MTHPYVPNPLREETPTEPERRVFHIALQVPQHGPFASNDPKASLAAVVVSVESTSLTEAGKDLAAALDDLVRDYYQRRRAAWVEAQEPAPEPVPEDPPVEPEPVAVSSADIAEPPKKRSAR